MIERMAKRYSIRSRKQETDGRGVSFDYGKTRGSRPPLMKTETMKRRCHLLRRTNTLQQRPGHHNRCGPYARCHPLRLTKIPERATVSISELFFPLPNLFSWVSDLP